MSTVSVEPRTRPRRWAPAIAAAAAAAVIGAGAYAYVEGGEPAGTPAPSVTTLAMPAGTGTSTSSGSCLPFDVKYLRGMCVALSGSASEVGDADVTIDVDHWYTGGDADVVRLINYDASTVSLDGLSFEPGTRYLITASRGTVSLCGFSGPWSRDLADAFERAFGS